MVGLVNFLEKRSGNYYVNYTPFLRPEELPTALLKQVLFVVFVTLKEVFFEKLFVIGGNL